VSNIPSSLINREEEEQKWWHAEILSSRGKSWWERRKCGPWCHEDWNIPGINRLDEIEFERTHPHQESEESKKETFEWTKRLAEEGRYTDYQYKLGRYYELGWGVEKDISKALQWYRKAAECGDSDAQYRLASAYFDGEGVPADYEAAYFWLRLQQMDRGVDAVGDFLNAEQRSEVENRCKEWIESRRAAGGKKL
jgi:hypothetical protein